MQTSQKQRLSLKKSLEKGLAINIAVEQHIVLVSCLLRDLIKHEQSAQQCEENLVEGFIQSGTSFDCSSVPQISLEDYLRRIHRFTKFSAESLIIAVIIMDRYNLANEEFQMSWLNVHRLLLSCLVLAVKLHDDFYFDNSAFEMAGGVNLVKLEEFELEIFSKCSYDLFIEEEIYESFVEGLYSMYAEDCSSSDGETQPEEGYSI